VVIEKPQSQFSLSRRMTRSAGLTLCPKNIDKIQPEELVLEIRMGVDFFFHYSLIEGSKTVYNVPMNQDKIFEILSETDIIKDRNCRGRRFT